MLDLISAYESFARASTDAPTKFHRYCAASLIGTMMGRRIWYQHGHRMLFGHTWVCLIGPSGVKKTTSLGIVEDLIAGVNSELVLPSKFSYEKLFTEVAKTPAGVLTYGELHSFLALLGRDFNMEAKSNLADWWDSPAARSYTTKGMGEKVVLSRPAVSILAGTTLSWFSEVARNKDVSGGFYARMLFTIAEKSDVAPMILPPPRDEAKANAIKAALADIPKAFKYEMHDSGRMNLSDGGRREYEKTYLDLHDVYSHSDTLGPFATRGQVYILKLAMISAIGRRRSLLIGAEDVTYGYLLVRDALRDIEEVVTLEIADTKMDRHLNGLRKLLRNAGPEGMTKRDLLKRGPVRDSDYFERIFKSLLANEYARVLPGRRKDSELIVSLEIKAPVNGPAVRA